MQRCQELVGLESTSLSVVVEGVGVLELAKATGPKNAKRHKPLGPNVSSVSFSALLVATVSQQNNEAPGVLMRY